MTAVAFDYAAWAARYPELAVKVDEALAAEYFLDAGLFVENSAASIVTDLTLRLRLLNMVTAHIAQLGINAATGGGVGRVSSASQGSVSVSFDYGAQAPSAAFWLQTPYGALFWQATARFRTFRYVPGPQPSMEPMNGPWPYRRSVW